MLVEDILWDVLKVEPGEVGGDAVRIGGEAIEDGGAASRVVDGAHALFEEADVAAFDDGIGKGAVGGFEVGIGALFLVESGEGAVAHAGDAERDLLEAVVGIDELLKFGDVGWLEDALFGIVEDDDVAGVGGVDGGLTEGWLWLGHCALRC